MKNFKFILGLFFGFLLGVSLVLIVNCTSNSPEQTSHIPNSLTLVKEIDTYGAKVSKLTVDNIQYIVVENDRNGGIAIIKHQ